MLDELGSQMAGFLDKPARLVGDFRGLARILRPTDTLMYGLNIARKAPQILRSRTLVPADRAMSGEIYVRLLGTDLCLDAQDFSGIREMYARSVYFVEPHCRPTGAGWAVDLGANRGLFSLLAARLGHRVLAVEAQAAYGPEIEARLARNGVRERVELEVCLVGDGSGVFAAGSNVAAANMVSRPATRDLEGLLDAHHIDHVAFLKADIEGSEFDLFRRPEWLARVQRLAMEVHPAWGHVYDLVVPLQALGFSVALRDPNSRPVRRALDAGYLFAWRA